MPEELHNPWLLVLPGVILAVVVWLTARRAWRFSRNLAEHWPSEVRCSSCTYDLRGIVVCDQHGQVTEVVAMGDGPRTARCPECGQDLLERGALRLRRVIHGKRLAMVGLWLQALAALLGIVVLAVRFPLTEWVRPLPGGLIERGIRHGVMEETCWTALRINEQTGTRSTNRFVPLAMERIDRVLANRDTPTRLELECMAYLSARRTSILQDETLCSAMLEMYMRQPWIMLDQAPGGVVRNGAEMTHLSRWLEEIPEAASVKFAEAFAALLADEIVFRGPLGARVNGQPVPIRCGAMGLLPVGVRRQSTTVEVTWLEHALVPSARSSMRFYEPVARSATTRSAPLLTRDDFIDRRLDPMRPLSEMSVVSDRWTGLGRTVLSIRPVMVEVRENTSLPASWSLIWRVALTRLEYSALPVKAENVQGRYRALPFAARVFVIGPDGQEHAAGFVIGDGQYTSNVSGGTVVTDNHVYCHVEPLPPDVAAWLATQDSVQFRLRTDLSLERAYLHAGLVFRGQIDVTSLLNFNW